MGNRFNLNESEKNRIRNLHRNHSVIKEQVGYTPECGGIEKDPKTNSRIWYPCVAAMMDTYPNADNGDEAKEIYAEDYRDNVINGDWDRKGWIYEYINGDWQESWDLCVDCADGDGKSASDYEELDVDD
jgi:hypothetical protein